MPKGYYRSKDRLTPEEYLDAKDFARSYPILLDDYNKYKDSVAAMVVDDMPHGKGGISVPTESLGMKRAEIKRQMDMIEDAAKEADPKNAYFIFAAATSGMTYRQLKKKFGGPSKALYYDRRRKFYWILYQKLKELRMEAYNAKLQERKL